MPQPGLPACEQQLGSREPPLSAAQVGRLEALLRTAAAADLNQLAAAVAVPAEGAGAAGGRGGAGGGGGAAGGREAAGGGADGGAAAGGAGAGAAAGSGAGAAVALAPTRAQVVEFYYSRFTEQVRAAF
jgi:hypothetical protein